MFYFAVICFNNIYCKILVFVFAFVSGIFRLQKAEPGHKLRWICRDLVWHVSLFTFYFFLQLVGKKSTDSYVIGQYKSVLLKHVAVYGKWIFFNQNCWCSFVEPHKFIQERGSQHPCLYSKKITKNTFF